MMTTNERKIYMGHDTTMCSAPDAWFPIKVSYSCEFKVKTELDRLNIENFVFMTYKLVDANKDKSQRELVSTINVAIVPVPSVMIKLNKG